MQLAHSLSGDPGARRVVDAVLTSSIEELDATVVGLAHAVTVPFLSLHGTDPGEGYEAWLTGVIPTAIVQRWVEHGHHPHLVDNADSSSVSTRSRPRSRPRAVGVRRRSS